MEVRRPWKRHKQFEWWDGEGFTPTSPWHLPSDVFRNLPLPDGETIRGRVVAYATLEQAMNAYTKAKGQ